MNNTPTPWNRLQALLDAMLGFTNRTRSTVKKVGQAFDNDTQEHIVWIEYRAQVKPTMAIKVEPNRSKVIERAPMASIREWFAARRRDAQA